MELQNCPLIAVGRVVQDVAVPTWALIHAIWTVTDGATKRVEVQTLRLRAQVRFVYVVTHLVPLHIHASLTAQSGHTLPLQNTCSTYTIEGIILFM